MAVELKDFEATLGREIRRLVNASVVAAKVEATIELGDRVAQTQRLKTGRLARSTQITGENVLPADPGLGFHTPASRAELTQQATTRIPLDKPGAPAHVSEWAGHAEGKPYGGFVEARFGTGETAVEATDADERAVLSRVEERVKNMLGGTFD